MVDVAFVEPRGPSSLFVFEELSLPFRRWFNYCRNEKKRKNTERQSPLTSVSKAGFRVQSFGFSAKRVGCGMKSREIDFLGRNRKPDLKHYSESARTAGTDLQKSAFACD